MGKRIRQQQARPSQCAAGTLSRALAILCDTKCSVLRSPRRSGMRQIGHDECTSSFILSDKLVNNRNVRAMEFGARLETRRESGLPVLEALVAKQMGTRQTKRLLHDIEADAARNDLKNCIHPLNELTRNKSRGLFQRIAQKAARATQQQRSTLLPSFPAVSRAVQQSPQRDSEHKSL